jgi:hypothetical protein
MVYLLKVKLAKILNCVIIIELFGSVVDKSLLLSLDIYHLGSIFYKLDKGLIFHYNICHFASAV